MNIKATEPYGYTCLRAMKKRRVNKKKEEKEK